ncbi:conjugal transfer protein TraG N-terminal domain-containing protein [Hydromonas duriensis]|uniref:TraG-like protein n=1 Tax=Hydromonas duriensis TaxID=1527608 RepID=A0A4R6Y505_9BURK|nr:conjugal transfer protein TraG N-terminal domain-containing protein [Hydromonas duriensis]TDR30300.1 TraG-like protein [Hydromonas duriensis]
MEYYTYGNVDMVYDMLNSVALMMGGNSGFESMTKAMTLIAFLGMVIHGVFKGTIEFLSKWFIGFMILWMGFFVPKADMMIVDQTNPTYVKVVNNMPYGLVVIGNISSKIGKWVTDKTEAVFTPVDDLAYSRTGMVFGANAYLTARKLSLLDFDPKLQGDWANFVENCSRYDVNLYHKYTLDEARNSTDLLTLLGKTNQALPTNVSGTTMDCDYAYNNLAQRTRSLVPQVYVNKLASMLNPGMNSKQSVLQNSAATAMSRLKTSYDDMFSTVQADALGIIQQEVMVNMVKMAHMQNAQVTGNTTQMQAAIAASQAEAQAINSQNTAAILAAKYLPIINNLIEAIVLALFPIVMLIIIMSGLRFFQVLIGYFTVIMWIKLWPGLFAIVNGIAKAVMNNRIGANTDIHGTTLANASDVLSIAHTTQATAGYLAFSVPVISWYLVSMLKGGIESLATSAASAGQRSSEQAGAAVGAGNINMGNSAWDSTNAHKWDTSKRYMSANMYDMNSAGMSTKGTLAAGSFMDNRGNIHGATTGATFYNATQNSLGVSANNELSRASGFSQAASREQSLANRYEAQATQSRTAANQSAVSWALNESDGVRSSLGTNSAISAQNRQALDTAAKITSELAAKWGNKDSFITLSQIGSDVGLGLSGGKTIQTDNTPKNEADKSKPNKNPSKFGFETKIGSSENAQTKTEYQRDLSDAIKQAKSQGISFTSDVGEQISKSKAFESSLASGNQFAQQTASNLSEAQSASLSASTSFSKSQSYREQSEQSLRHALSMSDNMSPQIGKAYADAGNPDMSTPEGRQKFMSSLANVITDSASPQVQGSVFDAGADVPIEPIQGGRAAVDSAYGSASSGVSGFAQAGQANVRDLAQASGMGGGLRGRINETGNSLGQDADSRIASNQSDFKSQQSRINDAGQGIRDEARNEAKNLSLGQEFARWDNETKHDDITGHLSGEVNNARFLDDPKSTASTVHAGDTQKPINSIRKVKPRWQK